MSQDLSEKIADLTAAYAETKKDSAFLERFFDSGEYLRIVIEDDDLLRSIYEYRDDLQQQIATLKSDKKMLRGEIRKLLRKQAEEAYERGEHEPIEHEGFKASLSVSHKYNEEEILAHLKKSGRMRELVSKGVVRQTVDVEGLKRFLTEGDKQKYDQKFLEEKLTRITINEPRDR